MSLLDQLGPLLHQYARGMRRRRRRINTTTQIASAVPPHELAPTMGAVAIARIAQQLTKR